MNYEYQDKRNLLQGTIPERPDQKQFRKIHFQKLILPRNKPENFLIPSAHSANRWASKKLVLICHAPSKEKTN